MTRITKIRSIFATLRVHYEHQNECSSYFWVPPGYPRLFLGNFDLDPYIVLKYSLFVRQ